MKLIRQHDERDCAATCLEMISNHYGVHITHSELLEMTKTDSSGTNLYGIVDAAKKIGFESEGLEGTADELEDAILKNEIDLPFIAHVVTEENFLHFVVVSKWRKGSFLIYDPGKGIYWQDSSEFYERWTGYVATIAKGNSLKKDRIEVNTLKRFHSLLQGQYLKLAGILMISIIIAGIGILGSFIFQIVIDRCNGNAVPSNHNDLLMILDFLKLDSRSISVIFIGIIALYLLQAIIHVVRGYLVGSLAKKIDMELSMSYYHHLVGLPMSSITMRNTGEYLSRFSDISIIRNAISSAVITLVLDTVMVVFCGYTLFSHSHAMFFVSLTTVGLYMITTIIYRRPIKTINQKMMEENSSVQSYFKESIDGIATIKAANAEDEIQNGIEKRLTAFIEAAFKNGILSVSQESIANAIELIGAIAILWVGLFLVQKGQISIGSLMTFYVLLGYFTEPIKNLTELQPTIQTAVIAADRLSDVLNMTKETRSSEMTMIPSINRWTMEHVNFRYGNRELALEDISFSIHKGERVGIVGESGCGKTTIAKLFLRFYDPETGKILMDDSDYKSFSPEEIRNHIAYVDQYTFLFTDTIKNNLKLGNKMVTDREIEDACRKAKAHEFIMSLPLGYDTPLEENGLDLSGGQRQRIAIARALLRRPQLLILDEATSNLDTVTESGITGSVFSDLKELSCLIIAHRMSTIKKCDRIILMDRGRIQACGTHDELMKLSEKYRMLWEN